MANQAKKVPINERALLARVDRALGKVGQSIRRARPGTRAETDLGRFYIVDVDGGAVIRTAVDLVAIATELNALKSWETLAED